MRRLLAWYPPSWRARYGEEFAELLTAELTERPQSGRRTLNVAASGLRARLAGAGLASHPLDPAAAARSGLATLAAAVAAFCVVGGTMWSQLAIAMQWSAADNRGITQAMDLMSLAMLIFSVLALLAAAPVACATAVACARGQARRLAWPVSLIVAGTTVLVAGGRHFGNAWPGTGGQMLAHQGLVPGGVAAFCWAATMWVTSYWAHPGALAAFSPGQLTWMVLSPAAAGCLVTGAVRLLRRLGMSPAVFRYETYLAYLACGGMAAFLAAALRWLTSAGASTQPLFHPGVIDKAGLVVLTLATAAGATVSRRARLAGPTALMPRQRGETGGTSQ